MLTKLELDIDYDYGEIEKVYTLQENHWWNLDYYLTPIILDALLQFKRNERAALPFCAINENELDVETGAITDETAVTKRWEAMLDTTIEAFQIMQDINDYDFTEELEVKVATGLQTFAKIYRSLWD